MIASPAGHGTLELQRVAGRTVVTRSQASSPLKLLTPRRRHEAAWVYTSTFGGGMVAGDRTHLDVTLHDGASCVLTTQASSKVYRDPQQKGCHQSLSVKLGDEALIVGAPDPVTCYAEAIFKQQQDFQLASTSSLVIVDWLTSGRRAYGEAWDFTRYQSRIDVHREEKHLLADTLLLDPEIGPLDGPFRLGRFHCLGLMVLAGPQATTAAEALVAELDGSPVEQGAELIEAGSPHDFGAGYRVAGISTQLVADRLRQRLSWLEPILGAAPWERKR